MLLKETIQALKREAEEYEEMTEQGGETVKMTTFCCRLDVVDVEILQKMGTATGTTKGTVGTKLLHAAIVDAANEMELVLDWNAVEELREQSDLEEL